MLLRRASRAANFALCVAIKGESARCVVALQSYDAPEEMRDINVIINKAAASSRAKFMAESDDGGSKKLMEFGAVQFSVCEGLDP